MTEATTPTPTPAPAKRLQSAEALRTAINQNQSLGGGGRLSATLFACQEAVSAIQHDMAGAPHIDRLWEKIADLERQIRNIDQRLMALERR